MNPEDQVKLFRMSHVMLERELDRLEKHAGLELQRGEPEPEDQDYYPQFEHALRIEAAEMGKHYEMFYCLEKSIRALIRDTLRAAHGENWWDTCVPQPVKEEAKKNAIRERDTGVTPRSDEEIDYITFGQLGEIVRTNWTDFGAVFSNEKAFSRVMNSLNNLRGSIAHCSPLAEDEVVRLRLTVRDWFRLME